MTEEIAGLTDDVRELIAPHLPPPAEMLEAISVAIASRRDEAKAARSSSGIEHVWKECEEAYVGIDDANRGEWQKAQWSKPMSMDGPVTTGYEPPNPDYKSTAFVRLTARYVDAGAAKLGEILLPIDDKAFTFSETPVPEQIKAKDDTSQVIHDGMGNVPLMRDAKPGEVPAPMPGAPPMPVPGPAPPVPGVAAASPAMPAPAAAPAEGAVLSAGAAGAPPQPPPQVPLTVKDLAEEAINLARGKAKLAETRIYDWMVECYYPTEMRKVIFDGARIGVGVLKAPYPKASSVAAFKGGKLRFLESIKPAAKWVDPWNIFPDPSCGENIQDGDDIFERDYLSSRQVRALKKIPGYIASQIDKVLEEGPDKTGGGEEDGGNRQSKSQRKGRFQVWYYYGSLKREEMDCICSASDKPLSKDDVPEDKKEVYAIVTLINSCVVRATINPLDSGKFPYHSVPWQRRAGHWAGIGVAEQIRMPQITVNAATRAMLNNAGKSAGSIIAINQNALIPADGSWILTPDKVFYTTEDDPDDVRKAITIFQVPNVTKELMTIIEYGMRLGEEATSIPLITQGQSGPTTPDTFGAAQLQNNNANQLLRSIGYAFDDYITEPVVRQFYEWLLLDPDVPDEEKGEFTINAHGSIALVERAIQDQTIAQMAGIVLNQAYGWNPKKWATEYAKSKRIDPKNLEYTKEEQEEMAKAPQPAAPAIEAAKIRAAVEEKKLAVTQQTDERALQSEDQRTLTDATIRLHDLRDRKDLALLDYANRHQISLDSVKAELAKTAMTLQAQKEMSEKRDQGPAQQVAKPAVEPNGRAPDGQAFQA